MPSSKASDIAANSYSKRDFRRMYPSTVMLDQDNLTTLLLAQADGFTSCVLLAASSLLLHDLRQSTGLTIPSLVCSLAVFPSQVASSRYFARSQVDRSHRRFTCAYSLVSLRRRTAGQGSLPTSHSSGSKVPMEHRSRSDPSRS